jgi:amino acid adenylation domain-containing protein
MSAVPPAAHNEEGALSYNQLSMWLIHQDAPDSAAYNVAVSRHIPFALDVEALRRALQGLVDRHAMLRTTYYIGAEGLPVQRTARATSVQFSQLQVPGLDDESLRTRVEADYRQPFDLQAGPVFRASLYTRGPSDHVLLMVAHHIACDGLSSAILRDDLTPLYIEAAGFPATPLPPLDRHYGDFIDWQAGLLESAEGTRQGEGWLARLAGAKDFDVPGDLPRPAQKDYRGASVATTLDAALTSQLRQLAREHDVTLYVLMLAAFDAMLYRLTGSDELLVGTPTAGRNLPGLARVVGNFVNPIALRTQLLEGMSFRALLERVRDDVRDGLGRQDYPMPLLVRRLHRPRDPARSPLYETFFTFLSEERDPAAAAQDQYRLAPFPIRQLEGQFDLALQVIERGATLPLDLRYSPALFDAHTAHGLLAHYQQLLAAVVGNAELPLERLAAAPTSVDPLLARLGTRGVRVTLEGDSLRLHAPAGAIDAAMKDELQQRKPELLAALRGSDSHGPAAPRAQRGELVLSALQQQLWWQHQALPGPDGDLALLLRWQGPLDESALARAVETVIRRHEVLRLSLHEVAGQPRAQLDVAASGAWRSVDLSAHAAGEREAQARREFEALREPRCDLAHGPLLSVVLLRFTADAHQLLLKAHPLVADEATLWQLWDQIAAAYAARSGSVADAAAVQYTDYAAWQRQALQQGGFIADLRFWMRELQDAPEALQLPFDHPRPEIPLSRPTRFTARLAQPLLDQLVALGRAQQVSLECILLAAWQVLLARRSGQSEVVVGSPATLREHPQLATMVGPLENLVALRARLGANPTFIDLLHRTAATRRHAMAHAGLPFRRVVAALGSAVVANRHPVFQSVFALRDAPAAQAIGLVTEASIETDIPASGRHMDLALELRPGTDGLRMQYSYAGELFAATTIERLHQQYLALLEGIATDATLPVRELSLLSAGERQWLDSLNQTAVAVDGATVVAQFMRTAALHRDRIAVRGIDGALSYGELDSRSSVLAAQLRAAGAGAGDFVALVVDRTTALPLAALGIMKAGAAYLPVDPSYPAERVALMLEDSGARHLVTTAALRDAVPARADTRVIVIDELPQGEATAGIGDGPRATDTAYLIYTSGSTGRPKGVLVPHSAVSNFLAAMTGALQFTAADSVLAVTSPSFDISVLELFVPLVNGGGVVVASREETADGERLARRLAESGATLLQATPSGWRLLMQLDWPGDPKLAAIVGGEPLPPALAAWLRPRVRALWNAYGPTETTVWSTLARIEDGPITVGQPIANTRIYLLGAEGNVLPPGETGEIVIAGDGVTQGYHQRPELTAERFVPEPGRAGARMYRTGDLGRWRDDGRLEHLGRLDDQVKLRGHRIELGEIEVRLGEHPAVAQAVVGVKTESAEDARLTAWVRLHEDAGATVSELRRHLRRLLPEYMVPSLIVAVERIPLAPNGKVDRRALAGAGRQGRETVAAQGATPGTAMQLLIAEVWKRLLGVPDVTLDSGFFDLGGHSLLAMRAAHEIGQRIGRTVDPRMMFLRNLGQLAEGLESSGANREFLPVI